MPPFLKKTAAAAFAAILASGCLMAPPKYGASGVVVQGSPQFDNYLSACSRRYPLVAECCSKWGTPSAIQIGNSGGYFVWPGQEQWVEVGSFKARTVTGRHPKLLRQYVGGEFADADAARERERRERQARQQAEARQREFARQQAAASASQPRKSACGYVIEHFERTSNDDFAYSFRLRLNDGAPSGLSAMSQIKNELRQAVVSDYAATYGGADEVRVDFPEFSMKEGVVGGRAEVMRIAVQSLRYDSAAQKGVISVKIGANRFEDARKWVRKNIEALAKDKNIALTTGQIPPNARFYLGAERVLEGNILEIEFETE